jgi:putative transposase
VKDQGWTPFPGRLWQRNYYERVIRENGEMTAIRKYIENNPYTWDEDSENPNYVGSGQQIQAPNTAGLHRRR